MHRSLAVESPQFLSPQEFVAFSGLSIATVRRYLDAGILPKVQPSGKRGRVLIPTSALTAFTNTARMAVPAAETAATPHPATDDETPAAPRRYGPQPRWLGRTTK